MARSRPRLTSPFGLAALTGLARPGRGLSGVGTSVRPVLIEMRIQGLGVIDEASIELHRGLTVVTGETGAGKTMVVTGLHLLSGGRAEASRVRTGVERAVVEGRFHTPPGSPAAEVAANAGADPDEDGSLIALRTVSTDGSLVGSIARRPSDESDGIGSVSNVARPKNCRSAACNRLS